MTADGDGAGFPARREKRLLQLPGAVAMNRKLSCPAGSYSKSTESPAFLPGRRDIRGKGALLRAGSRLGGPIGHAAQRMRPARRIFFFAMYQGEESKSPSD